MKLYHFPIAPNPAKVLAYVREKGLDELELELELVDFLKGEQNSPAHLARSPRGTVPVLELDDGTCLTESLPIMEYLEEAFPEPPMIGSSPVERAQVRARERYIELNITNRLVRLVHATNSPLGLPPNPGLAESERKNLPGSLAYVDELVADGPVRDGCAAYHRRLYAAGRVQLRQLREAGHSQGLCQPRPLV